MNEAPKDFVRRCETVGALVLAFGAAVLFAFALWGWHIAQGGSP